MLSKTWMRGLLWMFGSASALGCQGSILGSLPDAGRRADATSVNDAAQLGDARLEANDAASFASDTWASSDAPATADDAGTTCTCAGRMCGDDGCGRSCGVCSGGASCNAGMCVPGGEVATRFSLPPWSVAGVSRENCQRFHVGDYIGIVNSGPVFARIHEGILWGESYEGMGTSEPFTAERFPPGAGQFKPSGWVASSPSLSNADRWCFSDEDPRTGWVPESIGYRPFAAGDLLTRADGSVLLVNGGPVWARQTGSVFWAEAYEGEGRTPPYTADRYPAGTGQYKPGHWLSSGGFDWRQASQFSETMP